MSDASLHDGVDLTHLRPTTTFQMLDRVFAVLRQRPGLFAALAGLHALPEAVYAIQAWPAKTPDELAGFVPYYVALKLVAQWPAAALVAAAFQTYLFPNRPLDVWSTLRSTSARVPYLILTYFIMLSLLFLVAVVVPTGLLQTLTEDALGVLSILMVFGLFGTAIYLAATWALIAPLVIIEKKAFGEALIRSMQLMKLKFDAAPFGDSPLRRIFTAAVLPAVLYGAALVASRLLAMLAVSAWGAGSDLLLVRVELLLFTVAGLIATPWVMTAVTLLYTECRMRREALDLQVRFLAKGDLGLPDEGLGLDEE